MTQEEINRKLELHWQWLNDESNGVRASFSGENLENVDFRNANLAYTYFCGVNLKSANLNNANLKFANFKYANLEGTNLENANLEGANLEMAKLEGANLENANLQGANLEYVDLLNANLQGANLKYTDFIGAKNIPYIPMACPEKGSFKAWKKIYDNGYYLIELLIPEDAKRSSSTSNKCRCDKAKVISITNLDTNKKVNWIVNHNFHTTVYKVGEIVYPDSFNENRWRECSNGIHFFIDKEDALNY